MAKLARVACALLVGWLGSVTPGYAETFLYVLGCDARIDKLDISNEKKIETLDLARIGDNGRVIPSVSRGLDGCLINHSRFDKSSSLLLTAVPVQARVDSQGQRDYRVLAFSVPSMRLEKEIRTDKSLDSPPWIELTADNRVRVELSGQEVRRTEMKLKAFLPDKADLPNQVIESSEDTSLVRLFVEDPGILVIAVVDSRANTVVRMQNLPPTTALDVHLSPDGKAVLVVEADPNGSARMGRLSLFSSSTGKMLKYLVAPEVKDAQFLSIAPSGKAIFRSDGRYEFVNLGLGFEAGSVRNYMSESIPEHFYADR